MRYLTKICSTLFIIVALVAPIFVFAQSSVDWTKDSLDFYQLIIQVLSWIWIVPAAVAGKLLSNEFVFGEIIWLNTYLFRIWNIIRTFSNFLVWGLFLWFIFKTIYDGSIRASIQRIFKLLIWAALINMSWFLMWVVVDFSLVATTAVSSLPVQVLERTRDQEKHNVTIQTKYCVEEGALNSENCDQTQTRTLSLDSLRPDADNMWGPIIYMWVGLLWFLRSDFISRDLRNRETIALVELIKIIILLLFTIPVVLLMVVNVIRIFWIWIWVMFSPIIVLVTVLWDDMPGKSKISEGLKLWESLWSFFGLIFQPVVVVWLMWVWLVLMTSMMNIISGSDDTNRAGTLIQMQLDEQWTLETGLASTQITWSIFKEARYRTLWFFGEAILWFFTIFLIRGMIKAWFASSKITANLTTWAMNRWKNFAMSLPVVPFLGGQSINSLTKNAWENIKKAAGIKWLEYNASAQAEAMTGRIGEMFGMDASKWRFGASTISTLRAKADQDKTKSFWTNNVKDALVQHGAPLWYQWHMQELTRSWFGNKTVANLRDELGWGSSLFQGIADDTTLQTLESSHWASLWNFIQWLINNENIVSLASKTGANATWATLQQRKFTAS